MDSPNYGSASQGMTPGTNAKKKMKAEKLRKFLKKQDIQDNKTYVLGISGGDCAGKKELIQFMFDSKDGEWYMKGTNKPVSIIHQSYFLKDPSKRFVSEGVDWELFLQNLVHLLTGNDVRIENEHEKIQKVIKPAHLLVLQGSHIFMEDKPIVDWIDSKIFIDSDSDVRLSRRIYLDTEEYGKNLNDSIDRYLSNIKPSYETEIEPCKIKSDLIIPHFGGGFDDHRRLSKKGIIIDKTTYSSNIQNARELILAHLKEQMAKAEQIKSTEQIEDQK